MALILTPYFLWHDQMDTYFASEAYRRWLISAKPYAWLVAIGLIVGDLVLPIPTSPIMATLSVVRHLARRSDRGDWFGAGGDHRVRGRSPVRAPWIEMLASEQELAEFRDFFDSWGTAGIIASRPCRWCPRS